MPELTDYPTQSGKLWQPDLHTHSQASDGVLTPSELVFLAGKHRINLLALTDHDTMSGIPQAQQAADEIGLSLIPGIEISTEGDLEVHVLGYFVSPGYSALDTLLSEIQKDRISREEKYLDALRSMDVHLTHDELAIPVGTMFSRPLLAKAMVKKGCVLSIQEAFDRYIGAGKPAYVPKLLVSVEETVSALRKAGAVPVLAHPGLIRMEEEALLSKLDSWIYEGLMGIEAYHPAHSRAERMKWDRYARDRSLLVTGGSDYHRGADKLHGELGRMLSCWTKAPEDAKKLLDLYHSR